MNRPPLESTLTDTLLPDTTLFRSCPRDRFVVPHLTYIVSELPCKANGPEPPDRRSIDRGQQARKFAEDLVDMRLFEDQRGRERNDVARHADQQDRKSTRLNSSH